LNPDRYFFDFTDIIEFSENIKKKINRTWNSPHSHRFHAPAWERGGREGIAATARRQGCAASLRLQPFALRGDWGQPLTMDKQDNRAFLRGCKESMARPLRIESKGAFYHSAAIFLQQQSPPGG
jgi:hypothetical protein